MKPPTVVIPSRNAANLSACLHAIERFDPMCPVIVVDDGVDWAHLQPRPLGLMSPTTISGIRPFVFARNCNLGINAAGYDADVVLLNDDAVLETPGGFTAMQSASLADPNLRLVSATTNVANNVSQHPSGGDGVRTARRAPGHHFPAVAFVCVLIPARTIAVVGLLDERFTAYGWEDTDYCRRIFEAGGKIGIHDGCFVDHSKLRSTFRGDPHAPGPIDEGREIYLNKWRT